MYDQHAAMRIALKNKKSIDLLAARTPKGIPRLRNWDLQMEVGATAPQQVSFTALGVNRVMNLGLVSGFSLCVLEGVLPQLAQALLDASPFYLPVGDMSEGDIDFITLVSEKLNEHIQEILSE